MCHVINITWRVLILQVRFWIDTLALIKHFNFTVVLVKIRSCLNECQMLCYFLVKQKYVNPFLMRVASVTSCIYKKTALTASPRNKDKKWYHFFFIPTLVSMRLFLTHPSRNPLITQAKCNKILLSNWVLTNIYNDVWKLLFLLSVVAPGALALWSQILKCCLMWS